MTIERRRVGRSTEGKVLDGRYGDHINSLDVAHLEQVPINYTRNKKRKTC